VNGVVGRGRHYLQRDGRSIVPVGAHYVPVEGPDWPWRVGPESFDRAFAAMAAAGLDTVRIDLLWSAVEPEPGHYDPAHLAALDAIVEAARRHGLLLHPTFFIGGEVGDAEALADQVFATVRRQLRLEAVQRRDDLLPCHDRRFLVPNAETQPRVGAGVEAEQAFGFAERARHRRRGDLGEHRRLVGQLVEGKQARVRPQLLVEEVLQLEGVAALLGIGRVERRVRVALLDRSEDRGRVGDRAPVHLQQRQGDALAAGQREGDRDVAPRQRRAADVGDPLVVERPAHLLAVVGDVELDQGGLVVTHCASSVVVAA